MALAAFAGVVTIGIFSRGIRGKARHLMLIEAGAGMTQGTARRYRGFFAASADALTVHSTQSNSVLSRIALTNDASEQFTMDREGGRLENIAALPWQTVVIREDATARLGDGISIVDENGDLSIINRSGRVLRSAILKPSGKDPIYFARIADGERVGASAGHIMTATPDERSWTAQIGTAGSPSWGLTTFPLAADGLPSGLLDGDTPGITTAWLTLERVATQPKSWFPEDVPVLLAQLEGGEGRTSDSGLRLDSDRVMVRVVGFGGRP
jgi:hypothetical protein